MFPGYEMMAILDILIESERKDKYFLGQLLLVYCYTIPFLGQNKVHLFQAIIVLMV